MLCWITILGGVLIMMGQHSRSEALFYCFRLEDQVPETHLLRLIEKHISFAGCTRRYVPSTREQPPSVQDGVECGVDGNLVWFATVGADEHSDILPTQKDRAGNSISAPWVRSRQDALEAAVMKTWS
jgi:hypothetical protein